MWRFEIRNTVPDYPCSLDTPAAEQSYDHINAMCFLFDGIPYRVVYGPLRHLARTILGKLTANAAAADRILTDPLVRALRTNMEPLVPLQIPLSKLYTGSIEVGSDYGRVLTAFRDIEAADTNHRLSWPFLDIQARQEFIPQQVMWAHMREIGPFSVMDIFSKSKKLYPALDLAVSHGRSNTFIYRPSRQTLPVFDGGYGNNRACTATGCEAREGGWCNTDSAGYCTVGSSNA